MTLKEWSKIVYIAYKPEQGVAEKGNPCVLSAIVLLRSKTMDFS